MLIGGAGFIGHNLALHLKSQGAEVVIVDSLAVNNFMAFTSYKEDRSNIELYLGIINERLNFLRKHNIPLYVQDARDYHALNKLFAKTDPQVVVQLAAVSHANKSNKDPFSTFDHSLRTLENALDASRARVEHFVYFSSSMVYGHFKESVVSEETICEPVGIYGALKYGGEKLVIAYNQVFDLPYTIDRPSALYGERCVSRRVGQIFIENALVGKEIILNGDGSDCLDFTYIADLVRGIQNVIENDNARNQTFTCVTEYRRRGFSTTPTFRDFARAFRNSGFAIADMDELYSHADALRTEQRGDQFAAEFPIWVLFELAKLGQVQS